MSSFTAHGTQRVFIVDDEPSLRDLFSVALATETREIVTCGNGFTALRILESESFDLILLDLSLPDTNGIRILEEMRRRGDLSQVALCSANLDEASFLAALELGVAAFIDKPVTLLKLRQVVTEALAGDLDEVRSAEEFALENGFQYTGNTALKRRNS